MSVLCKRKCIYFNSTCAFVVHVQRGAEGSPLLALQKLASVLMVGGEETLEKLHPVYRWGNELCAPIRHQSFLASKLLIEEPTGEQEKEWLNSCATVHDDSLLRAQLHHI